MARRSNRLTTRQAATIKEAGRHADGGNLYLAVDKSGSRRWTFLYQLNGKQREAGLGPASTVTLAEARTKAAECRKMLVIGVDPLDAKKAAAAAARGRKTFGGCAEELIAAKRSEWRSAVHAHQWQQSVQDYCASIRDLPVDAVDTAAVLSVLQPIWATIPETATRVRGRIEAVLDYAKAHELRDGENPARWRGHLSLILPKRAKLSRGHHAAMPYAAVPAFSARLRELNSVPARALEFLILTAGRLGEVLGARWDEIDIEAAVWVVPAGRMKAAAEHRVPLSTRAIAIVAAMGELRTGDLLFPGRCRGRPLSATPVRRLCQDHTVHGFRSAFRDWAGEETNFQRELAEAALAHAIGNAVEQAYRRGDALEKRRALMEAWAAYCEPSAGDNVVPIRGRGNGN